jgi:hypothetical protein
MALTFIEEQLHNVHLQPGSLRDLDPMKRQCPWSRLLDPQRSRFEDGNKLSDGSIAVQHRNGLTRTHGPQVLAQSCLEVSDAYLFHGSIMTRSSHVHNLVLRFSTHRRAF